MHPHDAAGSHEPLDPLVVGRPTPPGQLGGDAGLAVSAVELTVDRADLADQLRLGQSSAAVGPAASAVRQSQKAWRLTSATLQDMVIGKPSAFRAAT